MEYTKKDLVNLDKKLKTKEITELEYYKRKLEREKIRHTEDVNNYKKWLKSDSEGYTKLYNEKLALEKKLKGEDLPYQIVVNYQHWDNLDSSSAYEKVPLLLDAGLWFLKLEKEMTKFGIIVNGQTLSFKEKVAAGECAKKLTRAGLWFMELKKK